VPGQLREVVKASLFAFPILLAFMATVYVSLTYFDFRLALALGIIVWILLAIGFFIITSN